MAFDVESLRKIANSLLANEPSLWPAIEGLCQAADEIEQLRARLAECEKERSEWQCTADVQEEKAHYWHKQNNAAEAKLARVSKIITELERADEVDLRTPIWPFLKTAHALRRALADEESK